MLFLKCIYLSNRHDYGNYFIMNETELKTAIIILQGCIKVRQDKIKAIEHNGIALDEVPRLEAQIDDLKLAVEYIKGVL